jgi:hypothetical protein
MNRRSFFLFAVCWSTIGERANVLAQSATCQNVMAKLATARFTSGCTSPVAFCATGTITGGGLVHGATTAVVLGLAPAVGLPGIEPNTTLSYVGDRVIETEHGTLTLRFTGVFDTVRGEFSELERVMGGTGVFEGATGTLWLTGSSFNDNNNFRGDLTGQICSAR